MRRSTRIFWSQAYRRGVLPFFFTGRAASSSSRSLQALELSQLSHARSGHNKLLLVDVPALMHKLAGQGFDVMQAKAITVVMTEVLNDCLQNVSDSFVSKYDLEQYNTILGAAYQKVQTDIPSVQEKSLLAIERERENLHVEIGKLQNEIRFEMDKVVAGQRLDLNLQRGRIKEELSKQSAATADLTSKLEKKSMTLKHN
ncbi:hypothetical protein KP509_05G062000 [Ceratopteris richardii]|uniref:Uncharacterized protein n=1 Tax=Ceratopteris richardii TaxID=49495 RepID=A0A8T2UR76_CERRI|nr:hypothetical protein KP509_05G062000 [Ceratopteris richardii]